MLTGAAAYGYIPLNDNVATWDSGYIFKEAREIISLIDDN